MMGSHTNELHRERFRLLVEQLGDEYGRPRRGWQTRVAERLGVPRSLVSRVARGDLEPIGPTVINRAMTVLKMSPSFFSRRERPSHWSEYTSQDELSNTLAARSLSQLAMLGKLASTSDAGIVAETLLESEFVSVAKRVADGSASPDLAEAFLDVVIDVGRRCQ